MEAHDSKRKKIRNKSKRKCAHISAEHGSSFKVRFFFIYVSKAFYSFQKIALHREYIVLRILRANGCLITVNLAEKVLRIKGQP